MFVVDIIVVDVVANVINVVCFNVLLFCCCSFLEGFHLQNFFGIHLQN